MRFAPPPPEVPRPRTRRGRWLARQRIDQAQGLFSERSLQFNFGPIEPGATAQLVLTVTSQGGRFVRCIAMRGTTSSDVTPTTGLELASLELRLQLNGDNDLVGGNDTNAAALASLFDDASSPWFWWFSPPLLRAGDLLTATITNTNGEEGAPTLTPELGLRLIDDELWQELYTREWLSERRRRRGPWPNACCQSNGGLDNPRIRRFGWEA